MTQRELMYKFGVNRDVADIIKEYLKEIAETDETFLPMTVNTVTTACNIHKELTGKDPNCEDIKEMYFTLPDTMRSKHGDKYLVGYFDIIMSGYTI